MSSVIDTKTELVTVRSGKITMRAAIDIGLDVSGCGIWDINTMYTVKKENVAENMLEKNIEVLFNDFYRMSLEDYLNVQLMCVQMVSSFEKAGIKIGRLDYENKRGGFGMLNTREWDLYGAPLVKKWYQMYKDYGNKTYLYRHIVCDLVMLSFEDGRKKWIAMLK